MAKIEDYRNDLSTEDIEMLEKEIGDKLPADYRKFLMNFNGGYPDPDGFKFVDISGEKSGSSVDRFLELGAGEYNNLKKYIDIYRGRIPLSFLPIAHDPGGNLILLCLSGQNKHKIYFWDHEFESDPSDVSYTRNIYYIADNFTRFLAILNDDYLDGA